MQLCPRVDAYLGKAAAFPRSALTGKTRGQYLQTAAAQLDEGKRFNRKYERC